MKRLLSSLVFGFCVLFVGFTAVKPAVSQLIYGNTFPFWNVNGPLTVTGTSTLSDVTTTSLSTTGTLTTAALSGPHLGVTNSGVAAAGYVGEMIQGSTTLASAVSLTSGYANPKGAACVQLTPGDWDVQGVGAFSSTSATYSAVVVGVNTNALSNVLPTATQASWRTENSTAITGASNVVATTPVVPLQLNANTTYCVVGAAGFASGTSSLWGVLNARRVR